MGGYVMRVSVLAFIVSSVALSWSTIGLTETKTYQYDALGRLRNVVTSGADQITSAYSLDKAGNRTNVKIQVSADCVINVTGNSYLPYSHDTSPFYIDISRSGTCGSPTYVSYATRNGSAYAGSSYIAKSGNLSLTAYSGGFNVTKLSQWGSGGEEVFFVDFTVISGAQQGNYTFNIGRESP
jgi:hypothetical protein